MRKGWKTKIDLIGQRFGRLVVLGEIEERKSGHVIWTCLCDCGNLTEVWSKSLRCGNTKSCGCLQKDKARKAKYKHGGHQGGKKARLYNIWIKMKQRCYSKNCRAYKYYGGKGIFVCKMWLNNYLIFKEWAFLTGYADNLTIDRIDNDGNYEPSNCQWLTRADNAKKRFKKGDING